jgi:predicted nucleic acid-binding protein
MKLSNENYLFDTTVFIDYLRQRQVAHEIFKQVRLNQLSVGYSILTEAELWAGIRGKEDSKNYLDLLKPFKRYTINTIIARRAGLLRAEIGKQKGQSIPGMVDCLIAATAEYHNLTACSRNTRDFAIFTQFSIKVQQYTL